jgi:hypothetical protein
MARQVKSKIKSMLIVFFVIKGVVHKKLSWQAKQSIMHTVMFYGGCAKICEDFAPNFGNKRSGCPITTTHCFILPFFRREFLTKSNVSVIPHSSYFSDSLIENKTERPPC